MPRTSRILTILLIWLFAGLAAPPFLNADDYYGNRFEVSANMPMGVLDTASKKSSLRFTAQASKTVTSFRVYIHANTSGSKTYRFGIQENSGGTPSGTWLSYTDLNTNTTGWVTVNLATGIALVAGRVYHIVVEPVGVPTRTITLRASSPLNRMIIYDQTRDPSSNTLFYDGAAWTVQDYQPIYFLRYSDSTYEGNPCSTPGSASIYGNYAQAERFTVTGPGRTIIQVGVYLSRNGSPPGNCDFVFYNVTDGAAVASGTIATPSNITPSYAWYTCDLPAPTTLVSGKQYRFYLKTTGGSASNCYVWCMSYNASAADYNSRNYDGQNSISERSSNGGATWPTATANYDAMFRLTLSEISITVNPSSADLGVIPPGSTDVISQTARPNGEIVITNSGSESVKYEVQLQDPAGWTAVDTAPASPDQYRLSGLFHPDQATGPDFERTGPSHNDVVSTTPRTCDGTRFATGTSEDGYDVPSGAAQGLYFDFDAPPSTAVSSQQAIRITITAKPMP
ncbi:MAG: hypothetical protein V1694_06180 [Candidatus Eisenbacteria bacterium]